MDGPDVLVGNSATPTNNHVEAYELLAPRLHEGRVISPLSYGDRAYGGRVADVGRRTFGARYEPLTGWMALDDYNRRIARCGFVVMNHRRQQAVGNVATALYKGATVYLRPENPMLQHFQDLGVHLRRIDELAAGSGPLVPLTEAQRQQNRERVGAHYRRARVVDAMRRLTTPAAGA